MAICGKASLALTKASLPLTIGGIFRIKGSVSVLDFLALSGGFGC
jgi:hypothetical protein